MTTATQLIAKVGIDTTDIPQQMAAAQQAMVQGVGAAAEQTQAPINELGRSFDVLSAQEAKVEQESIRTAQALARLQAAQGNQAGAIATLRSAKEGALAIDERTSYQLDTQIARFSSASTAAEQFGESFKNGMLNVVGPAAAATLAIGALEKTGESFIDAFKFEAQLEANQRAIAVQLQGIRDSGEVFQQAQHYADEYKLTQQQTTEAIQASLPVIRNSKASIEEVLGVFDRLRVRAPEKTFQDAARALSELQAGQYTSIQRIFNIPLADAKAMSDEIKKGGDAIQIVSQYLTDAGIGMDALKTNTEGAAGAMRDVAKAQEDLKRAQAEWAQGPGLAFLETYTEGLRGLTRLLGGAGGLSEAFNQMRLQGAAANEGTLAESRALQAGATAAEAHEARIKATNDALLVYAGQATNLTSAIVAHTTALAENALKQRETNAAQSDRVDISKLEEGELDKLRDKLDQAADRSQQAYSRLSEAQTTYARETQERGQDHAQKLADMAAEQNQRVAQIDADYAERRADAQSTYADRRAEIEQGYQAKVEDINRTGAQKLSDLDASFQADVAEKRQAGYARLAQIDADLNAKIEDDRRQSAQRLTELESQARDTQAQIAAQAADRAEQQVQRLADVQSQAAERLAEQEAQALERREQAQQQYQDRVAQLAQRAADLQSQAAEQAAERQRQAAERMADLAQSNADRATDAEARYQDDRQQRAEDHQDRLSDLQQRLSTATTDAQKASIQRQIAQENERYQRQEERAQQAYERAQAIAERNYQRQVEQVERERARAEEQAAARLAQEQARIAQEQAQQEQAYAQQEAKAAEAAARQKAQLEQQAAEQLATLQQQQARENAQAEQKAADQIAHLQQQIANERAAEARREQDARDSAIRERTDLIASVNADLAERQHKFDTAYAKQQQATADALAEAQSAYQKQLEDAQTAYAKQEAELDKTHAKQRASAETAYAERLADDAAAFARQERDRQEAYDRQEAQLKAALARQLRAQVEAQYAIGQVSGEERDRRLQAIGATFGSGTEQEQRLFEQFFNRFFAPQSGPQGTNSAYNGGTTFSGPITVIVQGVTDPIANANATRDALTQLNNRNGTS